jgi:hypothetical protein
LKKQRKTPNNPWVSWVARELIFTLVSKIG